MKLKTIISMLEGSSLKNVASELRVGKDKLQDILKQHDFEYNRSNRSWFYIGKGLMEDVLDMDIENINNVKEQHINNINTTSVLQYISDNVTINDIENIISVVNCVPSETLELYSDRVDIGYVLFKRVNNEIDRGLKRTRKTYPFSDELQKRIDKFSSKYRLEKQELLELALNDFFDKYGE